MNVFFIYFGHVQLLFPTLPPSVVSPPLLPLILDPLLFFILLPPHLHAFGLGVKVRFILVSYFNLLIIP